MKFQQMRIVAVLVLALCASAVNSQDLVEAITDFLRRGTIDLRLEEMDNKPMKEEYDFIVVGAGTAGCTMAARLSENPKWKVLLLEAGGHESLIMDVPILVHFLQLGSMNWKYRTQPSKNACLAFKDNRCNWPRGKVMGGSSVLNYMIYTRGNRRDYDRWVELGNEGWSYKDILPLFKRLEDSSVPNADKDYVGRGGPVTVSYVDWKSSIAKAFIDASAEDGLKYLDYNGQYQVGASYLQTTTRNATRTSSNRAYLYPIKEKRKNLHIRKGVLVTKVLIDPKTKIATGVLAVKNGKEYHIRARMEVILSAGAINSPQLLMLSGIGPGDHLKEKGIEPIVQLPVGYNLMDHTAAAVIFTTNASSLHFDSLANPAVFNQYYHRQGPYGSPGGCEAISFYDLKNPGDRDGWPDIELFLVGGSLAANPAIGRAFGFKEEFFRKVLKDTGSDNVNAFMIFPMILKPKSRGRIMLKTKDPQRYPLIYPNYFHDPYDLDIAVQGVLKSISLVKTKAFKRIKARVWERPIPDCIKYGYGSRAYWECYVRHITLTIYHYSGTCKMGPRNDSTAVVDPRLRVYGVKNLRVVDASIMPEIVAGHPNGPVFMIAEKAADMIKEDYNVLGDDNKLYNS